jgi:hypothetical protein
VSQALFPDTEAAQNLVAINPPTANGLRHALSTPLIVGISCAAVTLVGLIAVLTIFTLRKRRTRARVKLGNDSQASFTKPELDASPTAGTNCTGDGLQIFQRDPDALETRLEIDGVERHRNWACGELRGIQRMPAELSGQTRLPPELAGAIAAAELPHGEYIRHEVYEVP